MKFELVFKKQPKGIFGTASYPQLSSFPNQNEKRYTGVGEEQRKM